MRREPDSVTTAYGGTSPFRVPRRVCARCDTDVDHRRVGCFRRNAGRGNSHTDLLRRDGRLVGCRYGREPRIGLVRQPHRGARARAPSRPATPQLQLRGCDDDLGAQRDRRRQLHAVDHAAGNRRGVPAGASRPDRVRDDRHRGERRRRVFERHDDRQHVPRRTGSRP